MNDLKKLMDILVCPICKQYLDYQDSNLYCGRCSKTYPIMDGIPILSAKISKHIQNQAKIFNKEYKKYKKYELENWRKSYLKRLFKLLELDKVNAYLDIGVGGSGYTVIESARKGIFSVGIDISLEAIRKAKYFSEIELKNLDLCNFVVCNAEYLPFKDNSFDCVSAISVLEHIPNDEQVIKEIARVIKPNGKVLITVPNAYTRINPIFWIPYYIHDKRVGHLRHYKEEDLIKKFSKYGFTVESVYYTGHFPKFLQILIQKIYPKLKYKNSGIWWKLEEMDLKRKNKKSGLQLTIVFRR